MHFANKALNLDLGRFFLISVAFEEFTSFTAKNKLGGEDKTLARFFLNVLAPTGRPDQPTTS